MELYNKWEHYAKLFLEGEDIEDYTEEELCNNPDFMKALIKLDKKSYIYMSDELKKDFGFIRDLVKTYKNDYDFCSILIGGYEEDCIIDELDNGDVIAFSSDFKLEEEIKQININELYAIVTEGFERDLDLIDKDPKGYALKLSAYYTMIVSSIRYEMSENPDFADKGYGFVIIKELLACNPVLLKYFAERFAMDIIDEFEKVTEYSNNLEIVIHNAYRTKEEYENDGFTLAVAKVVQPHDPFLFDYLVINKDSNMFKRSSFGQKQILSNWNLIEQANAIARTEEFNSNIAQALDVLHVPCVYSSDVITYIRENYEKDANRDFFDPYYDYLERLGFDMDESDGNRLGIEFIKEGLEKNDLDTIKLIGYAVYLYGKLTATRIIPKDAKIKTFDEYFRDKKDSKPNQRKRKKDDKKDN